MRAQRAEQEHPCQDCKWFVVAAKRGLERFRDGSNYMVTGTCGNEPGPLYQRKLTGNMRARINGTHHQVDRAMEINCYEAPLSR